MYRDILNLVCSTQEAWYYTVYTCTCTVLAAEGSGMKMLLGAICCKAV